MINNIGPIPVEAGDVVRDQQDGVDYVVRASALVGAGALAVYGISLYDQSIRTWTADTYAEMGIKKVMSNYSNDAPEAVVGKLTDLFEKPGRIAKVAGKADFFESLFSEQGTFFRDLLMIGGEMEEFNGTLGKMAKALVGVSHRVWNAEEIFEAFRSAVHPDAFDEEFLRQFAGEFAFRIKATADLHKNLIRPNMPGGPQLLQQLMLPQSMGEEGVNFGGTALQQLGGAVTKRGQRALGPEARKLTNRALNPDIGDPIINYLGLSESATASDRLTALISKVMQSRGSRDSTMVVQSFMASLVKQDAKKIVEGKHPSAVLATLMDDKNLTTVVNELAGMQKIVQRSKNRSIRYSSSIDRGIERQLVPLKKVSLGQLTVRHQEGSADQYYSVDANTFLYHYMNGRKIKIGDKSFDLNSRNEIAAASKELFQGQNNIFGSSRHLIQALRNLEKDEVADLTNLAQNSESIRRRLSRHVLASIDQIHQAGNIATSRTRGVVGFRFNTSEFTPRLLNRLREAQKESSTAYSSEVVDELVKPVEGYKRLFVAKTNSGRIAAHTDLETLDRAMGASAEKEATTYYYAHLTHEKMQSYMTGESDVRNLVMEPVFPFGDYGMVGNFKQQFASLDPGMMDPTARIRETVEGVTGAVDFSFKQGYQYGKMSFVSIKNIDGSGAIRVVGTDLGSTGDAIQQQLNRADMLLDPDSQVRFLDDYGNSLQRKPRIGFLDLETDPHSGRLKEISIASAEDLQTLMELTDPMEGDFRQMSAKQARSKIVNLTRTHGVGDDLLFKTVDRRASVATRLSNLTRTVERLESFDQVWAQSTNDYRFLIDEVESIFRTGKLSKPDYDSLINRIVAVSETKGVTAETIPQLTGHLKLGNSSQPLATARYLEHQEFHVALLDNLDAYKLQTRVYREEYMKIRKGLEVIDLQHSPLTVVFQNSRLSDVDNQKIHIIGMESKLDLKSGDQMIQLTYHNALGHTRVQMGTPAQLGRAFGELADDPVKQTFQQFLDHDVSEKVKRQAAVNLEDRVRRLANEMNPLAEYIMDVGQKSGLKGAAISQPRGAKVFRARYLSSKMYADFVEGVGQGKTSEAIEEAAGDFVGKDTGAFKAVLQRYGVKHSMSDELLDSTRHDVMATLTSMTDAGEAPAIMEFFKRLGGAGDALMGLTLNESTLDNFDASVLHLFDGAKKTIAKTQEGVHFSLRMPDIQNKMRAKVVLTEAMDRDPTQAVNQFVSEIFSYAALDPGSKAGEAARTALESAGVKDLEGVLGGVLKHATNSGWKQHSRRFLQGQTFTNNAMTFGMSEDFTDIAGLAGTQFLRGYSDLPEIFARTFADQAEQLTDTTEKERVAGLAGAIRGRIARIQAEASESSKDISLLMGHAVRQEVGRFLKDGDVQRNLAMLTPEVEVLDVMEKISDQATVEHAIRQVNQEFDNPDAMELLNHALSAGNVEEAVKRLKQEAVSEVSTAANYQQSNLSAAAEQVVRGASMEGAMNATIPAGKNSEVELLHRAVNKATPGASSEGLMEAVHELTLGLDPLKNARMISSLTKPLMVIGGAIALLAAVNPAIDSNYTGGLRSKQHVNMNDPVNRFSEIPGAGNRMGPVFVGQEQPFKLDINIRGLAANEAQKQLLIDRVYDTLNQNTEYFSKKNTIREQRLETFRHPAAELLKANL